MLESRSANENRIRALAFFESEPVTEVTVMADGKNANYIVATSLRRYFVKTRTVERDRYHSVSIRHEYDALRVVGDAGLAPRAMHISDDSRVIVMECLEGAPCDAAIRAPENLPRAALALTQLHALDPRGVTYRFEAVIGNYLLRLSGSPLLTEEYAGCVRWVLAECLRSAGSARQAMCHGDLAPQNMMESGGIKLIDLEMAGENDLHFDLATFILFNGLSPGEEAYFLQLYGEVSPERLHHAKLAVSARDGLWALSEMADGKTEALYPQCAQSHLAIMSAARAKG
jgi:Ser/Thr protein kinase RdoA (MazF antagonist)